MLISPRFVIFPVFVLVVFLAGTRGLAENEGQEDLDKATEAKLTASTLSDLAEVIRLCESAMEKGLSEENADFAKNLLASALMQRAETVTSAIFDTTPPDPRWPQFRRLALGDLEKAVKLSPEQPKAFYMIARLNFLPGGDAKRAAEALDQSIRLNRDQPTLKAKALVLRATREEDPKKRLADLDEAVKAAPRDPAVVRGRGLVHADLKHWEKALADFKTSLVLDPEHAPTYEAQALVLASLKRYDEAMASLDKAAELEPDSVSPLSLRARVHAMKPDYPAALAELDKALTQEPGNVILLLMRAEVHEEMGNRDKALADVDRVIELKPELQTARRFRAALLAQSGKTEEVIRELQELLKTNPKDIEVQLQLAMFYTAEEKSEKAIALFSDVLAKKPDNVVALRGRGDALLGVGKHAEAIADYNKALEKDPEDPGTLNNLAWVLATSPEATLRDGKRAIKLATQACEKTDYQKAHILSTLAAAYAETGDFKTAVKWSKKALELGEEDQKDELAKELASFEADKPWRELLTPDKKKSDPEPPKPSVEETPAPPQPEPEVLKPEKNQTAPKTESSNKDAVPCPTLRSSRRPIPAHLLKRLPHRHDVFGRHFGLDVVDRVEDESTAGHERLDVAADVPANFVRGAVREDRLGLDPTAPEGDVAAEIPLQRRRLHALGRHVDRVEDVDAHVDEIGQIRTHVAAGMEKEIARFLGRSMQGMFGFDEPDQFAKPRGDERLVSLERDELTLLGAVIVVFDDNVNQIAQLPERHAPEAFFQIEDIVQNRLGRGRIGQQVAEKIGHASQALPHLEHAGAKALAHHDLAGLSIGFRLFAQTLQP